MNADLSQVDISVVIATLNRRDSLRRLLDSLWQQTLARERFEVIVVSDGSTDGTGELVRSIGVNVPNLHLVELSNSGPAAARNAGARVARGRYIAFTDDDCVPSKEWLEQLLLAFKRTSAVALQGRTTTDHSTRTPLTHQIEIVRPWTSSMSTCNAGYQKAAFDAAGGFDESFKLAHNEDRDLIWRVEDFGPVAFIPEAHVVHPPRPEAFAKVARRVRVFESDFLLYQKNPLKYRQYISSSPWRTIYYNVALVQQLNELKSNFRYILKSFRPVQFLIGIGIVSARWFYLLRFLPVYLKAAKRYRPDQVGGDGALAPKAAPSKCVT